VGPFAIGPASPERVGSTIALVVTCATKPSFRAPARRWLVDPPTAHRLEAGEWVGVYPDRTTDGAEEPPSGAT